MRRIWILGLGLIAAACSSGGGSHSSSQISAPTTEPSIQTPSTTTVPGATSTTSSSLPATATTQAPSPGVTQAPSPGPTQAPTPSPTNAPTTVAAGGLEVVHATHSAKHGEILTDTQGRTLYLLSSETGGKFTCTQGLCTTFWPPVLVPAGTNNVTGDAGVKGHVGVIKRPEGSMQVTYNGYPVYRYQQDSAAGDANGEGVSSFGGTWYVLSATATSAGSTAVKV
jgi:predicted lipoprotein with Yx(FWY)xxD motif